MRRRSLLVAAPAIILASSLGRFAGAQTVAHDPVPWRAPRVSGNIVARLREGVAPNNAAFTAILRRHKATLLKHFNIVPRAWRIKTAIGDGEALAAELENSGLVEYAHPHFIAQQAAVPNDPGYAFADGVWQQTIKCPQVWDKFQLTNYASMPPCIDIDTGVQGTYSGTTFTATLTDLPNSAVVQTWNVSSNNTDVIDVNGHGTGVAGFMAAVTNNNSGVSSVGWGGTVIPIAPYSTGYIDAYDWLVTAVAAPAFVSNPFTLGGYDATYVSAVQAAWAAGFMSFGAPGDSGAAACSHGPCDVPAPAMIGCTAVDGVGSTPLNRGGVTQSNTYAEYGAPAQAGGCGAYLAAPGGDNGSGANFGLPALLLNGSWQGGSSGTSYAVPIVCGIARFLSTINPALTIQQIYNLLTDTSLGQATTGFGTTTVTCVDFNQLVNAAATRAPTLLR